MDQPVTKILVVEDEEALRFSLREGLEMFGHQADAAAGLREAFKRVAENQYDLVLTDLNLIGESGLELIRKLRGDDYEGGIVVMTAFGSIESAVEAVRLGADEYLQKPLILDELSLVVGRTLERRRAQRKLRSFERLEAQRVESATILGSSDEWIRTIERADRMALATFSAGDGELPSILITGETGAGKGVIAERIHATAQSAQDDTDPFVHVNCAALPSNLIESELFGHEKGAFTDASEQRQGLFEAAEGGTIFLDEIGEMPIDLQPKLLLVVERGVFRRVGASKDRSVRCRVIAATNQDLASRCESGLFRSDLMYRLSTFTVEVPPLRQRKGDIALIAGAMVERFGARIGRPGLTLSDEALAALTAHRWPGNVRELINTIQRAAVLADTDRISAEALALGASAMIPGAPAPCGGAVTSADEIRFDFSGDPIKADEIERQLIIQALEHTQGNITKAARLIGMNRTSFRYRIERAGLEEYLKEVSGQ
ncbi:MAG: sigma-54-dependent Fis family transcriptional regulator [Phycisphaeraceae bacterium]|nr:sigma-54-dependent Fis family transcriptional regulator [Phycisphaeraceae bacterium]MCB9847795.1 sigma-54-dependent Fis family transcriptional regulator [Phycisphaeraceae bacterium]